MVQEAPSIQACPLFFLSLFAIGSLIVQSDSNPFSVSTKERNLVIPQAFLSLLKIEITLVDLQHEFFEVM